MAERDAAPPRPDYGRAGTAAEPVWDRPVEPRSASRLADELEPGALRAEISGTVAPRVSPPVAPVRVATFRFTGDGAEYFRIWVVNLLLTLVTLGAYSAWAKVRKTRYFWRNTELDGHVFDYHGNPVAILIGRIVALLLVIGSSIAFDISRTAGLVMVIVLCIAGPWLFMRAQRFKLVNSSWRGLRFAFDARASQAYRAVLPPLLIWFSAFAVAGGASGLLVPWMHHRLKAYQHRGACYGDRRFDFASATPAFYGVYFKAGLLLTVAVVPAFLVIGMGAAMGLGSPEASSMVAAVGAVIAGIIVLVGYLVFWPYFAARLQAVVWSHTRLGDVRFFTSIAAWPFIKLVAKNVGLTLITVGLYWPFAAIAVARYRVECMRAESTEPIAALAEATRAAPGLAAGDAALDAFGLDIGL